MKGGTWCAVQINRIKSWRPWGILMSAGMARDVRNKVTMKPVTCFASVACQFPDEPAFDVLRHEAQECLKTWSRATLARLLRSAHPGAGATR